MPKRNKFRRTGRPTTFQVSYLLVAVVLIQAITQTAIAQQLGDLDLTFSGAGKLTDGAGYANAVSIQPDGKIVALGTVLARYNPDGSADTTFGGGTGKVAAVGESLAIQPDGKIVIVCGSCSNQIWLARYNTNGSLDTSFSGDGIVITPIPDYTTFAFSVAIQSDGKIVAAGSGEWWYASDFGTSDPFLVRYNPDGSLDMTFGTDGVVKDGGYGHSSVTIQSDDKIVTTGRYSALARYNSNGSLDTSFGTGGRATTQLSYFSDVNSVVIQPDGKIVAAGYSTIGNSQPYDYGFALIRLNSNGSLDTSFDGDGKVVTPMGPGWNFAQDLTIQPDGRILAAGYSNGPTFSDFAIVRYNTNGLLDSAFGGGDGIGTVDFDSNSNDLAHGMTLDPQGRAVVVGQSDGAFALARFILGSPVPVVSISGRVTTPDGRGLRNAVVAITDQTGNTRTVPTSSLGFYGFDNVDVGPGYKIAVTSKRYRFGALPLDVTGAMSNVDFVGLE